MKILVNAPTGLQELIEIGEGGGYFDAARVVWDERTDGDLPEITLGGMKRVNDKLVFDPQLLALHNTAKATVDKAQAAMQAMARLVDLDDKSVRSVREFLLAKFPGDLLLPKDARGVPVLPAIDAEASKERAKLK